MPTGTSCAALVARPSATTSIPARSAAYWPTRSCWISTPGRGFPFRIAGSRANALFLKELRGLPFLDLWRGDDREEVASILHCVADETQPFLIGAEAHPEGLRTVGIEIILLPLRHHGLTHPRVFGGLALREAPGWMGLTGTGRIALTSLRAPELSARETLAAKGVAQADFSLRNMPKRYKHLFVYSGDRPHDLTLRHAAARKSALIPKASW